MAGRIDCCRYQPSLDDLLDDEIMAPVLRSAGFDAQGLRDMMARTARRMGDRRFEHRAAPADGRDPD